MKKKIFIALTIMCLMFLAGGTYIIVTIERDTTKLDNLITLHQVEILREHLLIQLKNVQSDLYLMGTRYEKSPAAVLGSLNRLKGVSVTCFDCHHTPGVIKRLKNLNAGVDSFTNSVGTIMARKGNRARLLKEGDLAFRTSQQLVAQVKNMVHMANTKLSDKTAASLKNISQSKKILYGLVFLTPFVATGFCFFFIREFVRPVNLLLTATRKLKDGNLDYQIDGLKDEFGEVATSFNDMSAYIKDNIRSIQESEKRYRTLFESAGDAIFIIDAEGDRLGDIVDANPAAAKMHGYSMAEILQLNLIRDLDAPGSAADAPERARRILSGEWIKAEIDHRKKDGTIFPVEISAGLLEHMGHQYILAIDRDISERKKMENLVLQSKQEWEDTFNTITDMITIHDNDFNIVRANKAAEKILGLPTPGISKVKCYQYYHGKDCPPQECGSCECYKTEKPTAFEIYEPLLDMHLEVRAMPRFEDDKQMTGLIHVIRDISERKQVEQSLQRTEQLKLVGEWAAGLAHEIKNPLAGIKGSVEVLLQEPNISDDDRSLIAQAVDEIKRIELLLKSLLNFAKPPQLQLMPTELNDLLDKTITFSLKHPLLSSNSPAPITVLRDFEPGLPETMADPMQMQQVFLNLMLNAIEAMPEGGELAVKTAYRRSLNSIHIAIADNGKGMEPTALDQIFQPFFTTKRKGTGLGLAITRRLVEEHRGELHVESTPGKGTVFKIALQVLQQKKAATT